MQFSEVDWNVALAVIYLYLLKLDFELVIEWEYT